MRRMLAVAVAASLLGVARAGEPPKAASAPGGEAEAPAGKAAETKKKGKGKAPAPKVQAAERKGEAKPAPEKPCEPIRPCPVE